MITRSTRSKITCFNADNLRCPPSHRQPKILNGKIGCPCHMSHSHSEFTTLPFTACCYLSKSLPTSHTFPLLLFNHTVGANIKLWCCHCGQRPDDLMTESEPDNSPLAPRLGRVSPGPGSGSGGGPGVKPGSGWWHCCRACNQLSQIFRNHREDAPQGILLVESACKHFHIQDTIKTHSRHY